MLTATELQQSIESARRAARICIGIALAGGALAAAPIPGAWVGLATIATFFSGAIGLLGAAHFSSLARARTRELEAHRAGSLARDVGVAGGGSGGTTYQNPYI